MTNLYRRAQFALLLALTHLCTEPPPRIARRRGDGGQTTAEYALVLLGAAGIALLLLGWATKSGAVAKLFDAVMNNVIGRVK